jgi:hypothetical protein
MGEGMNPRPIDRGFDQTPDPLTEGSTKPYWDDRKALRSRRGRLAPTHRLLT